MRPSAYKNTLCSQKFQKPMRRVAILHANLQLFFELCKKKEAHYILLLRNDVL